MSRNNGTTAVFDRLPPHSHEAEQAILGAILLSPNAVMPLLISKITCDEMFYDLRHQMIYGICVQMHDSAETIDLVMLREWLVFQDKLEAIGGVEYLSALMSACPSAAGVESYVEVLDDHYRQRKLIQVCTQTVSSVYDHADETNALVEYTAQELMDLGQRSVQVEEQPMAELVQQAIHDIEQAHSNQGTLTGIPTGFVDFDRLTCGLQAGDMIIIAARPSLGKTSLSMNIVEHVAVDLGLPVGVFSLEMTRRSLVTRMLCSRARVNLRNIRDGFLSERDMPRLTGAAIRLNHAPIFINDTAGLSILGLRTRARRMHQQHQLKLLVIDYIQLMNADRNRNDSRQNEVSTISAGVKALAKELNIPVIALSQLNRKVEDSKETRPNLSSLRESGSLEQDADLVCMLYRPKTWEEEDDPHSCSVNLFIAKQRNGPTGDVPLTFIRGFTRFESAAKVTQDDVPNSAPADTEPMEQQPEMI